LGKERKRFLAVIFSEKIKLLFLNNFAVDLNLNLEEKKFSEIFGIESLETEMPTNVKM